MLLDDLLRRRLLVLSGKGGVGKSVVGTALALAARDRGQRVLLIEIDTPVSAARFLGANPSLGHAETQVLPGHGQTTTVGHERRTNPFVLELIQRGGSW